MVARKKNVIEHQWVSLLCYIKSKIYAVASVRGMVKYAGNINGTGWSIHKHLTAAELALDGWNDLWITFTTVIKHENFRLLAGGWVVG